MANLTTVTYSAGAIANTTAGTVSTLDNLLGPAGTPSTNVQSVQGVSGGTPMPVTANAGTNLNTSALALESGGNLAATAAVAGTTAGAAVVTDANGTLQQYLRGLVKLFASITFGTYGTAPGAVAALNVNANVTNALSPGRQTVANSSPVVLAKQDYQDLAASTASTAIKGQSGTTGAAGDWLDFVLIIPETTAAGTVTLEDGANAAINIFVSGTLASLVPFAVPIRANSANGAWKISTGANVHVRAVGNFT